MPLFEALPLSLAPDFPSNSEFKVNDTTVTVATVTNPDVGVADNGNFVVVWQQPFNNNANDLDVVFRRFDAEGNPLDTDDQIATNQSGNQTAPAIAVAPDGRFVIAYVDNDDIFVRRFDANGTQLGGAILVSTFEQAKVQSAPDIAIDAEGDFSVVWTHQFGVGDRDVRGSVFNADGTIIQADTAISVSASDEFDPSIAVIREENNNNPDSVLSAVVSWTQDTGSDFDILFQRFGNEGNTLGSSVNAVSLTNQARNQQESSIAIDQDGNFAIAWTHEFGVGDDDIHFRRFNPDGTAVDNTEIIVDNSSGDQDEPVIGITGVVSGDGSDDPKFVIAYEDDVDESVKFREFDSDGDSLGDSEDYGVNSDFADNPAIAINDQNQMIITADDDQTHAFDPYARQFGVTSTDLGALTLTGGTAQIAYVAYYGRPADNSGQTFWNDTLSLNNVSYSPRNGDLLTGQEEVIYNLIVNDFGNSAEANRLFGGLNNEQRINLVYNHAFDRDAEAGGLAFWTEQLNLGNATLATFALEVALGAQNQDIVTLRNKIESAARFSTSIDTPQETIAYVGGTGELFGRTWLDDFGDTVTSQANVNAALDDLVAG
ncbi:MAG: DUF4214 domain-containing protein [Microcystaceae cyanobacterium]